MNVTVLIASRGAIIVLPHFERICPYFTSPRVMNQGYATKDGFWVAGSEWIAIHCKEQVVPLNSKVRSKISSFYIEFLSTYLQFS